jgi:hypothetical protein
MEESIIGYVGRETKQKQNPEVFIKERRFPNRRTQEKWAIWKSPLLVHP